MPDNDCAYYGAGVEGCGAVLICTHVDGTQLRSEHATVDDAVKAMSDSVFSDFNFLYNFTIDSPEFQAGDITEAW